MRNVLRINVLPLTIPTFWFQRIFSATETRILERFKLVESLCLVSIHFIDLCADVLGHFGYEGQNMFEHDAGDFLGFLSPGSIRFLHSLSRPVKLWHFGWFWLLNGTHSARRRVEHRLTVSIVNTCRKSGLLFDTFYITQWGSCYILRLTPTQIGLSLWCIWASNLRLRENAAARPGGLGSTARYNVYVHQIGINVLRWIQPNFQLTVLRFYGAAVSSRSRRRLQSARFVDVSMDKVGFCERFVDELLVLHKRVTTPFVADLGLCMFGDGHQLHLSPHISANAGPVVLQQRVRKDPLVDFLLLLFNRAHGVRIRSPRWVNLAFFAKSSIFYFFIIKPLLKDLVNSFPHLLRGRLISHYPPELIVVILALRVHHVNAFHNIFCQLEPLVVLSPFLTGFLFSHHHFLQFLQLVFLSALLLYSLGDNRLPSLRFVLFLWFDVFRE